MSVVNKLEIVQSREFINGKISIYNDGKCKRNSWESRLLIETEISGGAVSLILVAYEDTRENALDKLNDKFIELMNKFQKDWNLAGADEL